MIRYSEEKKAVINPCNFVKKIDNMPSIAIACYSHILFKEIRDKYHLKKIGSLDYTDMNKEIYQISYKGANYAVFMMSVGGPAAATCIEDMHAMGVKKFIVFGNCGVLDKEIEDLAIIIPNKAIRDEGVSYHYIPDSLEIEVNQKYGNLFKELLNKLNYSYVEGKTWTTDAFYRETKEKVAWMKEHGAKCVDMEVASISAVCQFRNIDLVTFFYAGDNLDNEYWDKRSLSGSDRVDDKIRVMDLALELASIIEE